MFTELRWTSDRIAHIARHGVTPAEVEEAVFGDPQGRLWRGPAPDVTHGAAFTTPTGAPRAGGISAWCCWIWAMGRPYL